MLSENIPSAQRLDELIDIFKTKDTNSASIEGFYNIDNFFWFLLFWFA